MLRSPAIALALATLTPIVLAGCSGGEPEQAPPSIAVNSVGDPTRAWVVPGTPQAVPPRPAWGDDWSGWAGQASATPLGPRMVLLTLQGKATVTTVRVKVAARRPAVAGTQFVVVSGDPEGYPRIEFDLDRDQPEARQVKLADGETVALTVQTQQCDCDWTVEVDWAQEGRTGTWTVDDAGKPFRVSAASATAARCVTYPDRTENCESFPSP